jgi:hypothetical protein
LTSEQTAQGAADQGRVELLLGGPTSLYEEADATSRLIETLAAGELVTVHRDAGAFLYVSAGAGRKGYIPDSSPVRDTSPTADPLFDETSLSINRDALVFMSHLEDEAERAKERPVEDPSFLGLAVAGVGLVALLLARVAGGLTNAELMVFAGLDVLLPLVILTANPKAPITLYWLAIVVYLALVTGYVAI